MVCRFKSDLRYQMLPTRPGGRGKLATLVSQCRGGQNALQVDMAKGFVHVGALLAEAQKTAARHAQMGPLGRDQWRRLVGERIAARSCPGQLGGGILEIAVESAIWAQELAFLAGELLARVRTAGVPVRRLRFRVSELEPFEHRQPLPLPPEPVALPAELDWRIANLEDAELAAAIAEAARYSLAWQERVPEARVPRSQPPPS